MQFTKLTEAEIAEFMELIRDSFDPELYTEDDLPALRAGGRRLEDGESQERTGTQPAVESGCGSTLPGTIVNVKDLSRDELVILAQATFDKDQWSPDDIDTLRACWEEFQGRGGENAVMFFRSAYFDVLKFHEVDSGEVGGDDVQMLERTGAEIVPEYREIMRKIGKAFNFARLRPPSGSEMISGEVSIFEESSHSHAQTKREIHEQQRLPPAVSSFLSLYRLLRAFPAALSREEALREIESGLPADLQLRLADVVDQGLD